MKAKELIKLLEQNPEAEIMGTSDDNWKLVSYNGVNLLEAGQDASGMVDTFYESEFTTSDGKIVKPIFIIW